MKCLISGTLRSTATRPKLPTSHRLLRYPLLYHPPLSQQKKSVPHKTYLDLIVGWGWCRSGHLSSASTGIKRGMIRKLGRL